MSSLYLLIPLSLLILFAAIALFYWAIKNKQFDDFEGPANKIILDDALEYKLNKKPPQKTQENKPLNK